jgi:hypothetical protein
MMARRAYKFKYYKPMRLFNWKFKKPLEFMENNSNVKLFKTKIELGDQ